MMRTRMITDRNRAVEVSAVSGDEPGPTRGIDLEAGFETGDTEPDSDGQPKRMRFGTQRR